jgi:hypothetical protein
LHGVSELRTGITLPLYQRKGNNKKVERIVKRVFIICTPPDIVRMVKSGRMSWMNYLTHVGEIRNEYRILFRDLKRRHRCKVDNNIDL